MRTVYSVDSRADDDIIYIYIYVYMWPTLHPRPNVTIYATTLRMRVASSQESDLLPHILFKWDIFFFFVGRVFVGSRWGEGGDSSAQFRAERVMDGAEEWSVVCWVRELGWGELGWGELGWGELGWSDCRIRAL